MPKGPFEYKLIREGSLVGKHHFRIYDARDNRIATCYDEENVKFIVESLNKAENQDQKDKEVERRTRGW